MKLYLSVLLIGLLSACTGGHSQSKKIQFTKTSHGPHQGKSTGHFKAQIALTYDEEDSLEFTAQIQRLRSADKAQVKWKLPPGAKVLKGEKFHSVDFSEANGKISKILVDKKSMSPGDQIFFFVFKMVNGKKIGVSQSFLYEPSNDVEASGFQQKSKKKKETPKYYE